MTKFSPSESQIKDIEIDRFFKDRAKSSKWASEIELKLEYQKSAYLATAEDCHLADHSFYYEDPNGLCFFQVHLINQNLSCLHLPIQPIGLGNPNINPDLILNKFREIIKNSEAKRIILSSELVQLLDIKRDFVQRNLKVAEIDLTQNEDAIFKGLSKGHKSSVKSGQKILNVSLCNSNNFSQTRLDELIELYVGVAKRNKSEKFWQLIKEAILEGAAFFTLGTYESRPVSCQLFYNGKNKVTYAMAAYDRDLMSQGLSLAHWPLYYAILESKKQDFKTFELGYLFEDNQDDKLESIFKFKAKFANGLKLISFFELNAVDL